MKKILLTIAKLPDWLILLLGMGLSLFFWLLKAEVPFFIFLGLTIIALPSLLLLRNAGFFEKGTDRKKLLTSNAKKFLLAFLLVSLIAIILPLLSLLLRR